MFIPEWEFPGQLDWHTSLTYTAKIQNALVPLSGSKAASIGIQGSLHRRHTAHTHSQSEGDTPKHCHIGGTLSQISQPHLHSVWDHCY